MRLKRWSRKVWGTVIACLLAAPGAFAYEQEVKRQAAELAAGLQQAGRHRVAVVDFVDLEGNANQLGRFLAEELSVALSNAPEALEVVDRGHLAAILREKKLSADGLVDRNTTRQLGQVLGVDVLIIGSLTAFGESVRVTTKAIDANTAKLVAASRSDIAKVGTIKSLFEASMTVSAGPAGTKATPAAGGGANPNAGSKPSASMDGAPRVDEKNKFTFELQGCELSGQTATCRLLAANRTPQQRTLHVQRQSRLVDDRGNLYSAAEATIANVEADFRGSAWQVGHPLYRDLPVRFTVVFDDIAPEATRAAALEIACNDGQREFTVGFKDVSFVASAREPGSILGQAASAASTDVLGGDGAPTGGGSLKGLAGELVKKRLGKLGAKLFGGGSKKQDPPPQQD